MEYCIGEHIESEIALKPEPAPGLRLTSPSSISNRRSRSSRNSAPVRPAHPAEHIESEIALKPEPAADTHDQAHGAYRIGDRAQAGTFQALIATASRSISNRRSRSSRNYNASGELVQLEHIESEIALKPEHHGGVCRDGG